MIRTPKCWKRKCKHYTGIIRDFEPEGNERHNCLAYPDGIPDRIAYGKEQHLIIQSDQVGNFVFEKKSKHYNMTKVDPVEINEKGETVFNLGATLASADPSVYGRLSIKARDGDLEAKRKMKEMENTPMYRIEEIDNNEEYEILKKLSILFPEMISSLYPFPSPFVGENGIKAIVLGADPTHIIDEKPEVFKQVFGLEKENSPYWRAMAKNLKAISLNIQEVYVQNLCRNYFLQETSKNKFWKEIAREYWAPFLKQELDSLFKPDVPILMTTEFILHAVLKDSRKKYKAKEIYSQMITIPKEDSLLGRELIAFYRHPEYTYINKPSYREFVMQKINSLWKS